jgi:hypothetical protein
MITYHNSHNSRIIRMYTRLDVMLPHVLLCLYSSLTPKMRKKNKTPLRQYILRSCKGRVGVLDLPTLREPYQDRSSNKMQKINTFNRLCSSMLVRCVHPFSLFPPHPTALLQLLPYSVCFEDKDFLEFNTCLNFSNGKNV